MSDLNLLFITTDQQRWDSLPCYGLEFMRTPHLDRLAREGVVFERCYTTAPLCVPMRAAMMGGQWPSTTGVQGNNHWLYPAVPTWPERVGATGRRTAAIGKMHFHPWDARNGFLERISAEDKRHTYLLDDFSKFLRAHGLERVHPTANPGYFESLGAPVTPLPKQFHVDGYVGDRAAEWLARHGGEPFAAWVSFAGPHDPYDPPEELAAMYYDAPIPAPIGSRAELATKPRAQQRTGRSSLENGQYRIDPTQATPEQHRRWRAHYYANISLIDEGIGKILAALEDAGTLDRTLIVFTSDHGDALGDHGLAYKSFFYESMAHVPLIVRGPGVAAGQRCRSLVSTLDLVPLFYQTCGVEAPPTLQGMDVSPLLADPSDTLRHTVFSESAGAVMVRDDRFKYVHYADGDAELYDLGSDPTEVTNLAGNAEYALEVARLRALLVEHALRNNSARARSVARPPEPQRVALEAAYRRERT
ncbi:MAG: sulfatase family protein [Chloroflexota bacterium]